MVDRTMLMLRGLWCNTPTSVTGVRLAASAKRRIGGAATVAADSSVGASTMGEQRPSEPVGNCVETLPLCSSPCLSYLCVRVQHYTSLFCTRSVSWICDQSLRVHVCLVARGWERWTPRLLSFVNCDLTLIRVSSIAILICGIRDARVTGTSRR